jgi:hypothetical protein
VTFTVTGSADNCHFLAFAKNLEQSYPVDIYINNKISKNGLFFAFDTAMDTMDCNFLESAI